MGKKDILPSISLLDADGGKIEFASLESQFGLWPIDITRLTLIFDPGWVKIDLSANQDLGRAVAARVTYRLVVSKIARGANGCNLAADRNSCSKRFTQMLRVRSLRIRN